jgi:hypothetical protein
MTKLEIKLLQIGRRIHAGADWRRELQLRRPCWKLEVDW